MEVTQKPRSSQVGPIDQNQPNEASSNIIEQTDSRLLIQSSFLKQFLLDTPSIVNEAIQWIILKTIERIKHHTEMKIQVTDQFSKILRQIQPAINLKHDERPVQLKNYLDQEPASCSLHSIGFVCRDSMHLTVPMRMFEKTNTCSDERLAKIEKTFLNSKHTDDKNYSTNNNGFRKINKQSTQINPNVVRNACMSLVSLETQYEPQSPLTTNARKKSNCVLLDEYKTRKQQLVQKQKRNLQNLKNVVFTFDYSSQRINVNRALRVKLPDANSTMHIDNSRKVTVQRKNSSNVYNQIAARSKKSILVDNLIQSSQMEMNHSTVLKGLLDKIMSSNKLLKMTNTVRGTNPMSRKKLF